MSTSRPDNDRCVDKLPPALMLIIGQDSQEQRDAPIEIDVGGLLRALTSSANGKYLWTSGEEGVRVWRVEDGKQVATMETGVVWCLAMSRDGRRIAAGTLLGDVFVGDAKTYEKVFSHREDFQNINGVDFSPDSTRLVSASDNHTATVWEIETGERVRALHHEYGLKAARYSPLGDRIATASSNSIRIWDSNDGCLLVDIKEGLTPWYNTGLLWFNNHLVVISDSKIKQFEASTGSAVSEWSVPESDDYSCIVLPKHGEFIAYSTQRTVTFWDTVTHTQLALIQYSQDIRSIALSADDRFVATCGIGKGITIKPLPRITVSIVFR
jgi:WD40 repeat protein